ncbi:hypothetical protein FQN54_002076 [Arachnomyces sp. PD_36]|nr:hypothetical protein FQN54_002076 [Arachnomyces sp. PD_36]
MPARPLPMRCLLRHPAAVPRSTATAGSSRACFSTRNSTLRSASHENPYDPPTGDLFGIKPGQKYEKEGWEGVMTYGFGGSLLLAVIAYAFKPDTSIQTWALEEARRRLEKEGILEDPDTLKKE